MGNKGSTDSAPSLTPVQQREVRAACDLASCIPALLLLVVFIFYQENLYEDYVTPALSSVSGGRAPGPAATGGSGTPPILTRPHTEHRRPQQGLERRSMTVVGRGDIVRLYAEKKDPPNLGHHSVNGHYYIGVYSYLRIRDRLNIEHFQCLQGVPYSEVFTETTFPSVCFSSCSSSEGVMQHFVDSQLAIRCLLLSFQQSKTHLRCVTVHVEGTHTR